MKTLDVVPLLLAITVALLAFNYVEGEISSFNPQPAPQRVEIPQEPNYLAQLYEKAPIMKRIAECESGDRQFYKDGTLVKGLRSDDTGRFQINYVHEPKARQMGIDLTTTQGNAQYALYLYNKKGTQPWYMSKSCWSPYLAQNEGSRN